MDNEEDEWINMNNTRLFLEALGADVEGHIKNDWYIEFPTRSLGYYLLKYEELQRGATEPNPGKETTLENEVGKIVAEEVGWFTGWEATEDKLNLSCNLVAKRAINHILSQVLHKHREKAYITCEETCFCWDIEKILTEHE